MSFANSIDFCGDVGIGDSGGKDVEKRPHSVLGTSKLNWNNKIKKPRSNSKKRSGRQEFEDNRSSNVLSFSQSDSRFLDEGGTPVDESSPSSLPSICPAAICRQFWKAGNYDIERSAKAPIQRGFTDGKNRLRVHPVFLHSNATSHKWTFGAIAELLDNAVDEIHNGASFAVIDKTTNPRDGSPALLVQDDGGGMDPEAIRHCMSFGFSDKKEKCDIGQYGNGFKTSSMRLGADVIVFTRHSRKRTLTQSAGLLSYTFLRQTGHDSIVVPLVDYEFNASTRKLGPRLNHGKEHFSSNLSTLLQWSPYSTEEMLLKQFDDIGLHGTKIVIYNLWLNDDGEMELDFNYDVEDIRINADPKLFQTGHLPNPVCDQHIANLYRLSLRAAVVTTVGFLKDAPSVNIHGFNIYHRNRLILPFWRVVKNTTTSFVTGVVGTLEANFIQPTHNKQDFEKTSIYQKLENRLKEMTMEYWDFHCGLIGYQQVKLPPPASVPSCEQLSSVGCFEDAVTTPRHISGRVLGQYSDHHYHVRSLQGLERLEMNRNERNPTVELEPESHTESGSYATDTQQNRVRQPSNHNETQCHNEETSLMQENQILRSLILELERREEDLNLKVQRLRHELGEVRREYETLLAESESMDIIVDG